METILQHFENFTQDEITIQLFVNLPQNQTTFESFNHLVEMYHSDVVNPWDRNITLEETQNRINLFFSETKFLEDNQDVIHIGFAALDGDKVIGIAGFVSNPIPFHEFNPRLTSVIVDPEYRGQGIATQLIEEVKNTARDFGFEHLYLTHAKNPDLDIIYKKLGWQKIEEDVYSPKDGDSFVVNVMWIDL